jgi:hypothetical protein
VQRLVCIERVLALLHVPGGHQSNQLGNNAEGVQRLVCVRRALALLHVTVLTAMQDGRDAQGHMNTASGR